ncbi:YeiH family protein [Thalassomonas actiniarum]|uniref:Sulfate exporter family transporter n=1 Tax=Thalassomonas actiniarum TaxID=485447 RepID=A0AAE9YNN2_9GAMM|nr:putative sulfate exporter family transporter [Thalassomonas actiniarum]WDD97996.1 putative sulfate exporter family transporter [Thalassomonas actiniarum]
MLAFVKSHYAGIFVCAIIAIAANALAHRYQAPVMLFALLLGLALHFLYDSKRHQVGIDFCSKAVLRFAVALLGVRIAFADIVSLGVMPPLIVVGSMLVTIFFGVFLARLLGLPKVFGVLSGGAVAVCGVSAAAAISTVLPKKAHQEKFFALTVISITALGTLAMLTYPLVTDFLGLSDEQAGVFIGGAIHDVAQVVGAGYSVSTEAGDIATYIKLLRVALLLPIVVMIFFAFKEKSSRLSGGVTSFIPGFLIAFFILALVNNLGFIPAPLVEMIKSISGGALVVSMVAIGVKTSLKQVVSVGWKPVFLMTMETVFFALLILAGIFFIG